MNPIIIFLRIVTAPLILKFPLGAGLFSILLDNLDWHTKQIFNIAPIGDYQHIDKFLDIFYLLFIFIVSLRFKNKIIKNTLILLFILRFVGFVMFEITGNRLLLFYFPNIFESFFFFYYLVQLIAKYEPKIPYFAVCLVLVLITILKLPQEYAIHVIQKPLIMSVFGRTFEYQDTNIQIIIILTTSLILGAYYKKRKKINRK